MKHTFWVMLFFGLSLPSLAENGDKPGTRASSNSTGGRVVVLNQSSSDIRLLKVVRLMDEIRLEDCEIVTTKSTEVLYNCWAALEAHYGIKGIRPLYVRASSTSPMEPLKINEDFSLMRISVLVRRAAFDNAAALGFYVQRLRRPAIFPIDRLTRRSHTVVRDVSEGVIIDFLLTLNGESLELKPFIDFNSPNLRVIYRNWDRFPATRSGANYSVSANTSVDYSDEALFDCSRILAQPRHVNYGKVLR